MEYKTKNLIVMLLIALLAWQAAEHWPDLNPTTEISPAVGGGDKCMFVFQGGREPWLLGNRGSTNLKLEPGTLENGPGCALRPRALDERGFTQISPNGRAYKLISLELVPDDALAFFEELVLPYLQTSQDPTLISDWYTYPLPVSADRVDDYFRVVARLEGGRIIMGDSDMIFLMLGLARTDMCDTGTSEVNVVRSSQEKDPQLTWKFYPGVDIPQWGSRKAPIILEEVVVNPETSDDLRTYVRNTTGKTYLVKDHFRINVPLKHLALAFIPEKGKVWLFFRTKADRQDYFNRILRLPDVKNYSDEHLGEAGMRNENIIYSLRYSGIVYAEAKPGGWRFDDASWDLLRHMADTLTGPDKDYVVGSVRTGIGQVFGLDHPVDAINEYFSRLGLDGQSESAICGGLQDEKVGTLDQI